MKYMMTTIPPPQFAHLSPHPDSPPIPTDRGENNVFQLLGGIFGRPFFAASPPSHPQLRLTPEGCQGKLRAGGGQPKELQKSDPKAERRAFPRLGFCLGISNLYRKCKMTRSPSALFFLPRPQT